jgi:hypothetical protein
VDDAHRHSDYFNQFYGFFSLVQMERRVHLPHRARRRLHCPRPR